MIEAPKFSEKNSTSEAIPNKESHFSSFLTAVCLMVCVCGFAVLLWGVSSSEVIPEATTRSRDLERLASRILNVESRLSDLSVVEQSLYHLWWTDSYRQEQLRHWYAEIPQDRRSPFDQLYMGIFDGEVMLRANRMEMVQVEMPVIQKLSIFQQVLDAAYFERNTTNLNYASLQARLAEEVPSNWFYFQLARRLASQAGDHALRENLHRQFLQLTDLPLLKWRVLIIVESLLGGIGLMCFAYMVVMRFKLRLFQSEETINQRASFWTFHEGCAVLVRGGALSILLIVLLAVVPYGMTILEDYGSLVLYLPTVAVAIILLCWPKEQSLLELLGCHRFFERIKSSLPLLLSVITLGLMGEWLIMLGGDTFDISVHWTEWFLPQLVWGSQSELLKTSFEVVVFAPFFEEIIFRGIIFSSLRAKFGLSVSLIGSAGIFALAHGYGPIAFLSVFWSGILWAWLYERTGSIVPGMCAHAVNNGLVVSFLVALFR